MVQLFAALTLPTLSADTGVTSGSTIISTWGPLLVAVAGLATALIAALTRKDRSREGLLNNIDARTNTAIKGLTEAYDRVDKERAREEAGRLEAEARAEALHLRNEELEEEVERCRRLIQQQTVPQEP